MLDDSSDVVAQERQKKTRLLIIGGVASLVLPLLGAAYLYWANSKPSPGLSGRSDVFERREDGGPIVPSHTAANAAAVPAATGGGPAGAKPPSSLDFIKADPDFQTRPAAASASVATAAPKTAAPVAPAASKSAAAPLKSAAANKAFVMPKLQPTRGFSNFGSSGGGAAAGGGAAGNGGGQDVQQMMQNLPPGAANNPDIQKYLQNQQGH